MHEESVLVRMASSETRESAREGERENIVTPAARCQCERSSADYVGGSLTKATGARSTRFFAALSLLGGAVWCRLIGHPPTFQGTTKRARGQTCCASWAAVQPQVLSHSNSNSKRRQPLTQRPGEPRAASSPARRRAPLAQACAQSCMPLRRVA